jgi:hypothetical protein
MPVPEWQGMGAGIGEFGAVPARTFRAWNDGEFPYRSDAPGPIIMAYLSLFQ